MTDRSILWRRLDQPGHEAARLVYQRGHWQLVGTAVFAHEQQPCCLAYQIVCDTAWQTLSATVTGWVGSESVQIAIAVTPDQRWQLNRTEITEVAGCIDVDLNFSPATNLFPIRRLALGIGQSAEVQAAWLRFPSFTLEPLAQVYQRTEATAYRYESAGGSFVANLQVNQAGFVTEYPNLWQAEAR